MKRSMDLHVSRLAEFVTAWKWALFPLVIVVPLFFTGVNRYFSGKDFFGDLGDYAELTFEMLILGGISVYLFRLITERNIIIQSLRDSEGRYRQLFDVSPDPMVVHRHGKILLANKAAATGIGAESPEELTGRSVHDFVHPDFLTMARERFRAIEELHTVAPLTAMKVVRMDGMVIYGELTSVPTTYDGEPAVLSVGRDMTSRKLAEEALRESEEKYRLVVDNAYEGIFVVQDGVFRFLNPRAAEGMGYTRDELVGKPFIEFISPDDRESVLQQHARRMQGDDSRTRDELRIVTREGTIMWVELESVTITWAGKPAGLCFAQDITERKRAGEALKRTEKLYRDLVDKATDIIYVTDAHGHFLLFNPLGLRVIEYSHDEIAHKHYLDLIPDEYKKRVERFYGRQFAERIPDTYYELPMITKHGRTVWIGQSVQLVTEGEQVVGFQAICRDITDRKSAEEALRESEERYRAVFTNAAVGINIVDPDGRFMQVNEISANMLGYRPEEMQALTVFDVTHPDDVDISRTNLSTLIEGKVDRYRVEKRYIRKDGEIVWADVSVSAIHDANKEYAATLGVIVDITERKRSEQERESLKSQLLHARKMDAIGTLTGGIAHEFNNLLTIISGYTELLLLDTDERDSRYPDLGKIVTACRRGAELVNKLRIFGRKADYHFRPVNLNHEVKETVTLLCKTIPKMVQIECELADGLLTVNADSAQVDQLLVNLAVNSTDAMPDGGCLIIETRNVTLDRDYCAKVPGTTPGKYVVLSVTDTGHGMDERTLNRIFEPFFTTRGMAQRSGLGLAVVHGIVEEHAGFITCESNVGDGTTFQVYLPVIPSGVTGREFQDQATAGAAAATILLVDDEPFLLEAGRRALQRAGYVVFTALNGREALALYNTHRAAISLVVLDLIMPEMGGKQCLEELLKIDPSLQFIIASGVTADSLSMEGLSVGAKGFISKPYNMEHMLGVIREVLDEKVSDSDSQS